MEKPSSLRATIFDVQGLSVHDGPGCRTVVFFKGCPLNCYWCSNPEGISLETTPFYNAQKCIMDGKCAEACLLDAITITDGALDIDRNRCGPCHEYHCIDVCLTEALRKPSYDISLDELMKIIQRDRKFWGAEGGITLSGGEAFQQFDFSFELLKQAYDSYIHTAIETCGCVPWDHYEKALPYLNWIYFDLKHMDAKSHKEATGVHNKLILENAKKLVAHFKGRLMFRTPIIPGFNDNQSHIESMIQFLQEIKIKEINILPLHNLGLEKYKHMGLKKEALASPKPIELQRIADRFAKEKIECYIGSETPF